MSEICTIGTADIDIVTLDKNNAADYAKIAAEILPEAWSLETYLKQVDNPDDYSFFALCNGEAAGFISVWCVCGEAEINNIGVVDKFRRLGIAKALFDRAYNAAKAEKWYLEVRSSNSAAISFYEKLGFEQVGLRKNFYTSPTENAILMALEPNSYNNKDD